MYKDTLGRKKGNNLKANDREWLDKLCYFHIFGILFCSYYKGRVRLICVDPMGKAMAK